MHRAAQGQHAFVDESSGLEKSEDTSSDKQNSTDALDVGTTGGLSGNDGWCLNGDDHGLRGLSRDGSGDGAVGASPSRGVARAASAGSGPLDGLGLGLGNSMSRRGAGGHRSEKGRRRRG